MHTEAQRTPEDANDTGLGQARCHLVAEVPQHRLDELRCLNLIVPATSIVSEMFPPLIICDPRPVARQKIRPKIE